MGINETTGYREDGTPTRARFEAGDKVYVADVYLPEVDFRSRLSDVANDPGRRFVPLSNVDLVDDATGKPLRHTKFMLLRLDAIDAIIPLRESSERPVLR